MNKGSRVRCVSPAVSMRFTRSLPRQPTGPHRPACDCKDTRDSSAASPKCRHRLRQTLFSAAHAARSGRRRRRVLPSSVPVQPADGVGAGRAGRCTVSRRLARAAGAGRTGRCRVRGAAVRGAAVCRRCGRRCLALRCASVAASARAERRRSPVYRPSPL